MASGEDEVTYESLRNIWKKEAGSQFTLTRLDPQFYTHVDARLRELQEDYVREHGVDPNSAKVMILQDEIRNLTRVRDDLWDMRAKKIAQCAIVAARGGNPDRSGMARGELELFENLVRVLKDGRRTLLKRGERTMGAAPPAGGDPKPEGARDPGDGATEATPPEAPAPKPAPAGPPSPPDPVPANVPKAASAASRAGDADAAPVKKEAELPGLEKPAPAPVPPPEPPVRVQVVEDESASGAHETAATGEPGPSPDDRGLRPRSGRVIVRVLKEVSIAGSDLRKYHLTPEDVVALPPAEARLLASKGFAEAVTPAA